MGWARGDAAPPTPAHGSEPRPAGLVLHKDRRSHARSRTLRFTLDLRLAASLVRPDSQGMPSQGGPTCDPASSRPALVPRAVRCGAVITSARRYAPDTRPVIRADTHTDVLSAQSSSPISMGSERRSDCGPPHSSSETMAARQGLRGTGRLLRQSAYRKRAAARAFKSHASDCGPI